MYFTPACTGVPLARRLRSSPVCRGSHAAGRACATHLSVTRAVTASALRQPLTWHGVLYMVHLRPSFAPASGHWAARRAQVPEPHRSSLRPRDVLPSATGLPGVAHSNSLVGGGFVRSVTAHASGLLRRGAPLRGFSPDRGAVLGPAL